MPIYGECGGLIRLARSLRIEGGGRFPMSGVLPIDITMDSRHVAIRYVEMTTTADSPMGPWSTVMRGQEFHQSRVVAADVGNPLLRPHERRTRVPGRMASSLHRRKLCPRPLCRPGRDGGAALCGRRRTMAEMRSFRGTLCPLPCLHGRAL